MTEYSKLALEAISESSFKTDPEIYIYAKVATAPTNNDHFLITRDSDEISVVTREVNLHQLDLIERNKDDYRLIALNVSVPFYSVGFLATVSDAFAARGMNVLIVSTYSKDYVLVRADLLEIAESALLKLGFSRQP